MSSAEITRPATREEARRAWTHHDARMAAVTPERLTAEQLERWLPSIEGRPVRVSAPGFFALPAPLEMVGVLSPPADSHHPDLGAIKVYELTVASGPVGVFFVALGAVVFATRRYDGGEPTVDIFMRLPTASYRIRITAQLPEVDADV
jgi:hypothetical protein